MKIETPRTTALIADIVQNPGLEWTRAEVEQLGEHAFQLECELNIAEAALRAVANRKTIGDEFDARKLVAAALKSINVAAMPNDES